MSYFLRAHAAWEAGNLRSAFHLFLRGAKGGDESCQQVLGYFYDEGVGLVPNQGKAIYWYSIACTRGKSSAAAYNLGLLYQRNGQVKQAAKFFHRAFKLGDDDAARKLKSLNR